MYKYEHGGNAFYNNPVIIDFSANINPLGLPNGVADAIKEAITDCTRYPDPFSYELREKIADYEKCASSHIICANGASEIIFRLSNWLRPKKALVLAPSFSDYERALIASGCRDIYRYQLYEENEFGLDFGILEVIKSGEFDVVWLCNPNNPTGCLIPKKLLDEIISLCYRSDCYVVVDECFMDFVSDKALYTVKSEVEQYQNLIVLKAFTKIFALAGIRLGYALCSNKKVIDGLCYHGADWSVSNLAQAAGVAALSNPEEYILKSLHYIDMEKIKLKSCFERAGFKVFGSTANYLFIKNEYNFDLKETLLEEHRIMIRSCGNYHGLGKQFCRIGVLKAEQNQKLIGAIKDSSYYQEEYKHG